MTDFASIPAIVLIAYFIGLICKSLVTSDKIDRLIPVICGCVGGVLGIIIFITNPSFIAAENWLTALAIGITSGLSATGANQIYKQLFK